MKKSSKFAILISAIISFSLFSILITNFSFSVPITIYNNNGVVLKTTDWSDVTAISAVNDWNIGSSYDCEIITDNNGNIHVVWKDSTDGEWGTDDEIFYAFYNGLAWSNATCISDDYTLWNIGASYCPSIAIDNNGNIHVVWYDDTDGEWGNDQEILYANYTSAGWSNATCISDDYTLWNDGISRYPQIAIDNNGYIHVVWEDWTVGEWGSDAEIMYANYTAGIWSNATAISAVNDWNTGSSLDPRICTDDNGNLHVVWNDGTDGEWGIDTEILYTNCTSAGWSNATCISDVYGWNDGASSSPDIDTDNNGNIHVVWADNTDGEWGTDEEIIYAYYNTTVWSNATVISDYVPEWNTDSSEYPRLTVDNAGNAHVVWIDDQDIFGTDYEILYRRVNPTGMSKITVIGDDFTNWNDNDDEDPCITTDNNDNIHIVFAVQATGDWGTDEEVFYLSYSAPSGPSGPSEKTIPIPISSTEPDLVAWVIAIISLIAVGILIAFIIISRKS